MTFQDIVNETSDITTGYMSGLQALKREHRSKVSITDNSLLGGSVDIDSCTTLKYPNANRWDYAVEYNGKVFFIEVHSAITSEVSTVIAKLKWLKEWLRTEAPLLDERKADAPYHWLQSSNFDIPKTAPQFKAIVQAGLKPKPRLALQ